MVAGFDLTVLIMSWLLLCNGVSIRFIIAVLKLKPAGFETELAGFELLIEFISLDSSLI